MSVTLKLTETVVMNVFRAVLLQLIPPDTPIIRSQINRVPAPNGDDWVLMTPLYRNRLSTNISIPKDCFFLGYIEGQYLTVIKMGIGDSVPIGALLSGIGIVQNTFVVGFDAVTGHYKVTPSQYSGTTEISAGIESVETDIDFCVQLDIYGSSSADNAHKVASLLRDYWGCNAFQQITPDVQTLYADDPRQMQFINSEQQYEQRWCLDVHLQANPVVQVSQQFADEMNISPIVVETILIP